MSEFNLMRRQKYIDATSYANTLKHIENNRSIYDELLKQKPTHVHSHARVLQYRALDLWAVFQLKYTAGESIKNLSCSMDEIVEAFERYVEKNAAVPEGDYYAPFMLDTMVDNYVDYLHLLSAAILTHRDDLLPTIFGWIAGGEYDGVDSVLEEILKFYFPDRPMPDSWIWEQPYEKLLDVIDSPSVQERPKLMRKYVRSWYPSMKRQASFCGKHEKITPEVSPYFGYWAMCAAAFTYLLDIDDASYHNEEVYPKDLINYARSLPRRPIKLKNGIEILRVVGGQACPHDGVWFSPAKLDSAQNFKAGEIMPIFNISEYGETIWQWLPKQ